MSEISLAQKSAHTIRMLSMDAVQKANSGHPGMPMGMADVAYVLFTKFLKHNPKNPTWFDRDRFILSAGHGSMLLYSVLHLSGYNLSLEEIKNFRQWGSKTPGHPEFGHTDGVETTTGPLGQGFATGVGMAMAEAFLASKFNSSDTELINHYTYAIVSDGDLMEGISHEAASLAGHQKLGKMIYLYDDNNISIDGSTDLAFTENVAQRFEAYGWHVLKIDGHNHSEIETAIKAAQQETERPSLICCKSTIGFGSPNKAGKSSSHGSPLGADEITATKAVYGYSNDEAFVIDSEVKKHFEDATLGHQETNEKWNSMVEHFLNSADQNAEAFNRVISDALRSVNVDTLPKFGASESGMATRKASGEVIQTLKAQIPTMFGGSADLGGSVLTDMKGLGVFNSDNRSGQNMHYGVREHAMVAAMNGMSLHGGLVPFGGTFLVFADYCKPSIRLASLMKTPITLVFTHDSIGLGEDGPTHQPVEHMLLLRSIPGLLDLRPADANETAWAWKAAIEYKDGPSLLALTRQNLPIYDRSIYGNAEGVLKGAYIFKEASDSPKVILMGTGSELQLAVNAAEKLEAQGIPTRVVSIPSWFLFEQQSAEYKASVIPKEVKAKVSVEAGLTLGWSKYVGDSGISIGLDHFGASAPYEVLYDKFGITSEAVEKAALSLL